jgi:hypothetical protein
MNGNEWYSLHYDESGVPWEVDSDGHKRVPEHAEKTSQPGEFTMYDGSRGHCEFCGSLYCRGNCFK